MHDRPIVYLDSASSALQPHAVINAMARYYETTHANVHRGVYATAEESTHLYEQTRMVVGRFIGAPDPAHEIVFTKNTTESINLVAHTWARTNLKAGDRILLTEMEHHANIVPWLMLAEEVGLEVRYLPVDGEGRLDLTDLATLMDGVKLVGRVGHVQRAGHHQPGGRDRGGGPQRRRAGPGRRGPAGAPRARRRDRHWGPTSSPSRATR